MIEEPTTPRWTYRAWDTIENKMVTYIPTLPNQNALQPYRINYILMQFTGLYDRNETPIYEGDICKNRSGSYEVIWDKYAYKFKSVNGRVYGFIDYNVSRCEVIGNIYENSNLLATEH